MNEKLLDAIEITTLVASDEGGAKDSAHELLQVFTASGEPLGLAPRLLCHRLGLLHKAVFCFFGDAEGRLLLQTRKDGRLDVAVGGHMSSKDNSTEEALLREIHEETGLELSAERLTKITEYEKRSTDRLFKPREMNRELRTLFFVGLSSDECNMLESRFAERQEKIAVLAVKWFDLDDVLRACDADLVADGLAGSMSHFLFWLLNRREGRTV